MASFIFRCQFCDAQPDPLTQVSLEKTVVEVTFGAYVEAMPEKWLVWHGHGPYGPPRYACAEHRGDLVAYLRDHYGAIGPHPWKKPPYPTKLGRSDRADRKVSLGEGSSMPRWGRLPDAD
ncbi:MAG TPA: hypothetical protein VGV90_12520 [Solirubrobacteraceae bacterium]|nr:hypothetical protein [Solirubrobacteraceae bacterium]